MEEIKALQLGQNVVPSVPGTEGMMNPDVPSLVHYDPTTAFRPTDPNLMSCADVKRTVDESPSDIARHTVCSPAHPAGARERHRLLRVDAGLPKAQERHPLAAFRTLLPCESRHCRPRPRQGRRETSRSDPGVASRHAFGTAQKYPTPHATSAVGNEGHGSLCQTRVCQPGWKHQGPPRVLDPPTGGRAR